MATTNYRMTSDESDNDYGNHYLQAEAVEAVGQGAIPASRIVVPRRAHAIRNMRTDVGVVLVSATAVFTARVVCEETLMSGVRGAQWEGFSPSHSIVDSIGLLFFLFALIWAFLAVILAVIDRSRLSATELTLVAVLVGCCGLRAVPQEDWQLLRVRFHGGSHVPVKWAVSAAANGEVRLLDYLLTHGADVNTRTQHGESLLGVAAAAGQMEVARMLIARGARLDNRTDVTSETPLTEGAQMNHTDMVKLLLDHGADPGARDVLDRTALDWAHENGNARMASLLLARYGERPSSLLSQARGL